MGHGLVWLALLSHMTLVGCTHLGFQQDHVIRAVGEHEDADVILAILFLPVPQGVEEHSEGLVLLRVGPDHHGQNGPGKNALRRLMCFLLCSRGEPILQI